MKHETLNHNEEPSFWNEVFFCIRTFRRPVLLVSLLLWMLPQFSAKLLPEVLFSENIKKIKDFADLSSPGMVKDVMDLLNTAIVPGYWALAGSSFSGLCFLLGYFYLLQLFISFFTNQANKPQKHPLSHSAYLCLRYGIGFILVIAGLLIFIQNFLSFFSFVGIPMMLAPVIAVMERFGIFRASWLALTCKFVSQQRLANYIQICGIGALFYLGHIVNGGLAIWIKNMDHFFAIPRSSQILNLGSETITLNLAIASLVEVGIRAWLVAVMIATSVCLYVRMRRVEMSLKNIGLQNYA